MAKILEFRPPAPKPLTPAELAAQEITAKQAVDMLVLGLLDVAMPKWIEREWPFRQLELLVYELRSAMEPNVPSSITRGYVEDMVKMLRPSWEDLISEVDPNCFW